MIVDQGQRRILTRAAAVSTIAATLAFSSHAARACSPWLVGSPALAGQSAKDAAAAQARRLISELKSKSPQQRRKAADKLGSLRARLALQPLCGALADPDSSVREAAAFAIGQLADPQATEQLVRVLKQDKDEAVRSSAAFALGMLGDESTAESLADGLDDQQVEVRAAALTALGLIGDERATADIADMLDDSSFDVRYDAVWALAQVGGVESLDPLRASLVSLNQLNVDDRSRDAFREAVQNAIDIISGHPSRPSAAGTAGRPRRAAKPADSDSKAPSAPVIVQPALAVLTDWAIRANATGVVELKALVGTDGRVVRAYVVRRLGYGLDRRAVEAALHYRFSPGMLEGLPQTQWVDLRVPFNSR